MSYDEDDWDYKKHNKINYHNRYNKNKSSSQLSKQLLKDNDISGDGTSSGKSRSSFKATLVTFKDYCDSKTEKMVSKGKTCRISLAFLLEASPICISLSAKCISYKTSNGFV